MNSVVKKPGMGTQKEHLIKLTQHPHDGLQPPVTTPVPGDPTPSSDLCKYQAHTWYTKQVVYVERERGRGGEKENTPTGSGCQALYNGVGLSSQH